MAMILWSLLHEDNNCGYSSNLYGIHTWFYILYIWVKAVD